jgi:trans-2,3-dihydro-3-hydroxyanthranilate isomerase
MPRYHYRLLNVFTRDGGRLTGNPLCVFEHGDGLDTGTMQAIALQFNLSETTFLLPPTDPSAQARVRIFTPTFEMPFAGHPTLGSAAVCRSLELGGEHLRLEMQAGVIPVSAQGPRWTLTAKKPSHRELTVDIATVASLLGLQHADIAARPLWVKSGTEQLIVPLTSVDAVRRAAPAPAAFRELANEDGHGMAYVFAEEGAGRVLARFFFPAGSGVTEDPATGSATANLGGWWLAMRRRLPCVLTCRQGEQIGRPSVLHLSIDTAGRISVGGEVVELGRGFIEL